MTESSKKPVLISLRRLAAVFAICVAACALMTNASAQTNNQLTLKVLVYLPTGQLTPCASPTFPIGGGPSEITDKYILNGVSTKVPAPGVGGLLQAHNLQVKNYADYVAALQAVTISSSIYSAANPKPSYCSKAVEFDFAPISMGMASTPTFVAGNSIYSLLADSGVVPGFTCSTPANTPTQTTCSIALPLNSTDITKTQMQYLYTDALSLIALSQKSYCQGTAGNHPCN